MMKIQVLSVERDRAQLRVEIAGPIFQNGAYTDVGNRFLRIISMHGSTGHHIKNNVYTGGGENVKAINTRDALQKELDKFANTPIKLQFRETVRVYPTTDEQHQAWPNPVLVKMDEARKAYGEGVTVLLEVKVFSNLPFTSRDVDLLSKFVPGGVYHITNPQKYGESEPYMALNIWMHGDRDGKDPWALAKQLRSKIQKAID